MKRAPCAALPRFSRQKMGRQGAPTRLTLNVRWISVTIIREIPVRLPGGSLAGLQLSEPAGEKANCANGGRRGALPPYVLRAIILKFRWENGSLGWLFQIFLGNPSLARRQTMAVSWITATIIWHDVSLNFQIQEPLPNQISLSRSARQFMPTR